MCGFDDTYRGSSSIGHNAKRHKPNAKAAPDKLPKGWMRIRSEKSRAIYYYSMFTGQSTFTQPSKNDNHTKKPENRKKVRGPRTPNEDGTEAPLTPLGPGAPTTPLAPGTPLGAAPITPTLHEVPATPHGAAAPITPTLHDVKPHNDMDAAAQPQTIEEWKSAQGRCFGHLKPLPTNWIRMYFRTTGKMDFGRLHVVDTILGEFCTYGDLCRTAVASRCVRELMQSCQGYAYEALLARLIFRNGGETQSIAAVVSEYYMVEQIKDTLELRHEFLQAARLPTHHVLQNEDEIQHLLQFAKDRYHSDPEQKRLQERDAEEGGNEKRLAGKHARWSLEMQRRCGNKALWQLVCFTGQFNFAALTWELEYGIQSAKSS